MAPFESGLVIGYLCSCMITATYSKLRSNKNLVGAILKNIKNCLYKKAVGVTLSLDEIIGSL